MDLDFLHELCDKLYIGVHDSINYNAVTDIQLALIHYNCINPQK